LAGKSSEVILGQVDKFPFIEQFTNTLTAQRRAKPSSGGFIISSYSIPKETSYEKSIDKSAKN